MEDSQIIKNLRGLKAIKSESAFKQGLKARIFDNYPKKVFSRGFLPFNFDFNKLYRVPALVPITVICLAIIGIFLYYNLGNSGVQTAQVQPNESNSDYFVLLEQKLDEINTPEDIAGVMTIFQKASDSIDDSAKSPSETAKVAKSVTSINKKVDQIEKDFGDYAKDLKDSAQVLTTKTAEALGQGITDTQKELVDGLIKSYESKTLDNPQTDLLQNAKEYYNNQQFELALETILNIGK